MEPLDSLGRTWPPSGSPRFRCVLYAERCCAKTFLTSAACCRRCSFRQLTICSGHFGVESGIEVPPCFESNAGQVACHSSTARTHCIKLIEVLQQSRVLRYRNGIWLYVAFMLSKILARRRTVADKDFGSHGARFSLHLRGPERGALKPLFQELPGRRVIGM